MINLALRTEYSFQKTYGFIKDVIATQKADAIGVADINNTFSHFYLNEICKEQNKKAIFGVRLMVVNAPEERVRPRGQFGPVYIFLAKNYEGLKEIYKLVERSKECFYYREHIGLVDVWKLSDNVIVISPNFKMEERIDYIAICNITSPIAYASKLPHVAINNNCMINADDKEVYQLFCGTRKLENQCYPQRILSEKEWMVTYKDKEAVSNTYEIAEQCNVEFPSAETVGYKGSKKIKTMCRIGAKNKNINLKDKEYKKRLSMELKLIKEKDFTDYFMIVHEMIFKAKKYMLVGPGRGSSGGSLVCYLLGITEVDPIKWGLLFERFIDHNREDPPDIDIDFPDEKRMSVIKELIRTNGAKNVKNLAVVSTIKHRGAIGAFAKELKIPDDETEGIKNSIIDRSTGDARFFNCIQDTFSETQIGKDFIEKYPEMIYSSMIEKHSRHSGTHAAGIIVATQPLINFASVNPRDNTVQLDKKSAEKMNLLKIDCLGLKTLTVLENIADKVGIKYSDFYDLELEDDKVFKLFRDKKVQGIFQFEGGALAGLCRSIQVRHIDDIIAITALARPGPLHSGGANKFAMIHSGKEEIEYVMKNEEIVSITESTMGVIVYQEQVMQIMRKVAGMPWDKVGGIKKAIAHKGGEIALNEFKENFINGAIKKGVEKSEVTDAWEKILKFAQYGFNKCISGSTSIMIPEEERIGVMETLMMRRFYKIYVQQVEPEMQTRIDNGFMPSLMSVYPDGSIRPQKVKRIFYNGFKTCYRYTLENDEYTTNTTDHLFVINGTWKAIGSAIEGDYITYYDDEGKEKQSKLVRVQYAGETDTYDIEMEHHHNYLLKGGIITHNSHSVAYGLISYWTAWAKEYHPFEFLTSNLNHPKSVMSSMRLIREMKASHRFKFIPFDKKISTNEWQVIKTDKIPMVVGPITNIDGIGKVSCLSIIKKRESGKEQTPALKKKMEDGETKFDILYPCDYYWGEIIRGHEKYGLFRKPSSINNVNKKGDYLIIARLMKKNVRDLNEIQNVLKRGGEVYDHNTKLLNITVEDDTESLLCRINRFDYSSLGEEVAEDGELEVDWYLIRGKIISDDIKFFFISEIFKLGNGYSDGQKAEDILE